MSYPFAQPPARIPRWLIWVGSIAIVFHLGAVGVNTLAAPSGPWPEPEGSDYIGPPYLALRLNEMFLADYLKPLCLTHKYHFLANRLPGTPGVYLEFRLKDEQGKEMATLKLPDENANPWVRHRQSLLTQQISWEDERVAPQNEVIAAPGQELPTVQYWEMEKGQLRLVTVDINQVPRNRPVSGPRPWSFMLARSYSRFLCQSFGAAKAEVLRHHQDAIRPIVLTAEGIPANAFNDMVSNFGEFSR